MFFFIIKNENMGETLAKIFQLLLSIFDDDLWKIYYANNKTSSNNVSRVNVGLLESQIWSKTDKNSWSYDDFCKN